MMVIMTRCLKILLVIMICLTCCFISSQAFSTTNPVLLRKKKGITMQQTTQHTFSTLHRRMEVLQQHLSNSDNNNNTNQDRDQQQYYSREIRLREEAESPFRKVRYFFYASTAAGALNSLLISVARIAAALSGVNTDLMNESVTNAMIDVGGLVVIAFLFQRDVKAEESRLKRAQKGATLAKLNIRGSTELLLGDNDSKGGGDGGVPTRTTTVKTLADLRRGRGIDKRVVIAIAGEEKINQILKDTQMLQEELTYNDLVVVPVVMPQGISPSLEDQLSSIPATCLAFPVGNNWKSVIDDETREAREQGVDVTSEGICIVMKKNGRVGQRTRGIFLGRMVGEVTERREAGMDVSNI